MGSDESRFNVTLIVRDKVTRQCPQTTTIVMMRVVVLRSPCQRAKWPDFYNYKLHNQHLCCCFLLLKWKHFDLHAIVVLELLLII